MMRLEDIVDFFKLKRMCENPYEVLTFRKVRDEKKEISVKFRDGHRIFIQGGTDQYHTFHRVYLRDEYRVNQHAHKTMKCVVDLGANVGYFATRVAEYAECVICYEPVGSNVEKAEVNRNGRKNIEIVNKAVAGQSGFIKMFKPHSERMSCRHSMFLHQYSKSERDFESVECITLDQLFEKHKISTCDLMKMDIEGAEYETLYNANDHTLDKIERIVGEYHFADDDSKEHSIQFLRKYLTRKHFHVEIVPNKRKENLGLFFCNKVAA